MRRRLPEISLIVATIVWGASFLGTKLALRDIGVFGLLATRYLIGGILLACVCARSWKSVTRIEIWSGVAIGAVFFLSMAFQTSGLQFTTSSKSAFITAFGVPLVPVFQMLLMRRPPSGMAWAGIALSSVGLCLISLRSNMSLSFGLGEWLTIGAAIAMALHVVVTGIFVPDAHPIRVASIQLATLGLLSLMTMPFIGETLPHFTPQLTVIAILMGLFPSALCILAMVWAQGTVSPTRATLIYSSETVWAALIGFCIGEEIPMIALAGAGLILLGIVTSELKLPRLAQAS